MAMGGAAIGAIGSIFQGVIGFMQGAYQAQVAKMNKQIAEENAKRTLERVQIEQIGQDRTTRATIDKQLSIQGASGLSVMGKSQMRTRKAAAMLGRMDALNVRQAGEIEAYNFRTEAANFGAQARLAMLQGVGSLVSGFFGAANSLVGASKPTALSPTTAQYAPTPVPRPRLLV